MKRLSLCVSFIILVALSTTAFGAPPQARRPNVSDKCPVCGMFVAKYKDFAGQIRFKDGATVFFDGPKDLFKYYLGLARYNPGKKQADVAAVFVTSYYTLAPIDGLKAWYVTGSDVYGPMGRELVPFEKETEAREFKRDHKGKAIVRFREVTPLHLKELE
ncbi:MAG TPA: nitrous oxide reductase accessory protein NosL [Geobacteraceae bacterium]